MTLTALLLGLGLGVRHATDADHLAAIGTLLQRAPGTRRAAGIAALWGLGHTATFLGVGLLIVVSGVRFPPAWEHGAELLVAVMLVALGVRSLWAQRGPAAPPSWRPVVIGLVHGLAGSAGIALLAVTTIDSATGALAYLLLFGAGTVLGMAGLTVLMAWALRTSLGRAGVAHGGATFAMALLSIGCGVLLAANVLSEVARP